MGRSQDLGTVAKAPTVPDSDSFTLTGPGGLGKTRLSLQAGQDLLDHYVEGVVLVDLTTVTQDRFVVIGAAPYLSDLLQQCPGIRRN